MKIALGVWGIQKGQVCKDSWRGQGIWVRLSPAKCWKRFLKFARKLWCSPACHSEHTGPPRHTPQDGVGSAPPAQAGWPLLGDPNSSMTAVPSQPGSSSLSKPYLSLSHFLPCYLGSQPSLEASQSSTVPFPPGEMTVLILIRKSYSMLCLFLLLWWDYKLFRTQIMIAHSVFPGKSPAVDSDTWKLMVGNELVNCAWTGNWQTQSSSPLWQVRIYIPMSVFRTLANWEAWWPF